MDEEKIPEIGPLIRRNGFISRNRNLSFNLNNLDDNEESDNEYRVNGIPCPQNGETIEAKEIIASCVICHVNQIQTVNFPCMHACFCLNCARPAVQHSKKCPQCRNKYMHVSMLYLSYRDVDKITSNSSNSNKRLSEELEDGEIEEKSKKRIKHNKN
jgi:hypothetical protein